MNTLTANNMMKICTVTNALATLRTVTLDESMPTFEKLYNEDNSILNESVERIMDLIVLDIQKGKGE